MDEIGRGTSTYDGISIAWAVAEYLVQNLKSPPKTLFATHYHELQELEQLHPGKIKNYHMAVVNDKDEPIFLHTILPGPASHSFGVAVAKLAGIPEVVIENAERKLHELENNHTNVIASETKQSLSNNFHSSPVILSDNEGSLAMTQKNSSPLVQDDISTTYNPPLTLINHLIHKELATIDVANMTPLEALNKLAEIKEKIKLFTVEQKNAIQLD